MRTESTTRARFCLLYIHRSLPPSPSRPHSVHPIFSSSGPRIARCTVDHHASTISAREPTETANGLRSTNETRIRRGDITTRASQHPASSANGRSSGEPSRQAYKVPVGHCPMLGKRGAPLASLPGKHMARQKHIATLWINIAPERAGALLVTGNVVKMP